MAEQRQITITTEYFEREDVAHWLGGAVGGVISEVNNIVDLSSLDGITISCNYPLSLKNLDRGFKAGVDLQTSTGDVVGVAMTVPVLRDGMQKSHLVFNADIIAAVAIPDSKDFDEAQRIIIHECGHVVHKAALVKCFPDHFLNYRYKNIHESLRCETWIAVIDEYYATRFSSLGYYEGLDMYESIVFDRIVKLSENISEYISLYRYHSNIDQLLHEVYGEIATTMKFTGYYLGCADALCVDICKRNKYKELSSYPFTKYIKKIGNACQNIYDKHGKWADFSLMNKISDILDEIAVEHGVIVKETADENIYVDVPFK